MLQAAWLDFPRAWTPARTSKWDNSKQRSCLVVPFRGVFGVNKMNLLFYCSIEPSNGCCFSLYIYDQIELTYFWGLELNLYNGGIWLGFPGLSVIFQQVSFLPACLPVFLPQREKTAKPLIEVSCSTLLKLAKTHFYLGSLLHSGLLYSRIESFSFSLESLCSILVSVSSYRLLYFQGKK